MIVHVYQTITIRNLTVNSLANSSVFQIGSAGLVKSLSNNFNTGGFTGPAPDTGPASQNVTGGVPSLPEIPLVPLPALGRSESTTSPG